MIMLVVIIVLSLILFITREPIGNFASHYPIIFGISFFLLGSLISPIILVYKNTFLDFQLPKFPEGIIKKWNSPAKNPLEIFSRRRGKVIDKWPKKPIKRSDAKQLYKQICKFKDHNPDTSYEQLAEKFDVSRSTVERALRADRLDTL